MIMAKSERKQSKKICPYCERVHRPLSTKGNKNYENIKKIIQDILKLSDDSTLNLIKLGFGLGWLNSAIDCNAKMPWGGDALSELKYTINLIGMCKKLVLSLPEENLKNDILLILLKLDSHFAKMNIYFGLLRKDNKPCKVIYNALQKGCKKAVLTFEEKLNDAATRCHVSFLLKKKQTVVEPGKIQNSKDQDIPPERRSTPLTITRMAQYWGGDVTYKKIRAMMNNGKLKFIEMGRQSFIFDTKYLPKHVIEKVSK